MRCIGLLRTAFGLMLMLAAGFGPLRSEANATQDSEIVVAGVAKQYRLSGRQLRAAAAAFSQGRTEFAPAGKLYFKVEAAGMETLRLSLRSGDNLTPIMLDADRFTLPHR